MGIRKGAVPLYSPYNPNPYGRRSGDCTVRAIVKATQKPWAEVYLALCIEGFKRGDMPSANHVWGAYLKGQGFERTALPTECPDCYTVAEFTQEHPQGTYILALDGHVVCVKDGEWFDSWDSGNEIPIYFWERKEQ